MSLYRRLPRGAELTESAREVTAALRALEGRELGSVELTAVGPGAFALSLAAGELEVSLRLDRQGARVASVNRWPTRSATTSHASIWTAGAASSSAAGRSAWRR